MSKMIGFPQVLLQLANDVELESTVRQAAVIYLKNVVHKAWVVDEDEKDTTLPISEQDKTPIRQAIIGSIVNAPEPIRVHLCSCVQFILRNDFPEGWPTLLEEIL
ncbi:importin-beta domain-containing protein, partial [Aphelenchoides avenae]